MRFASPVYLWFLLIILPAAAYLMRFRFWDLPGFRFSSSRLLEGLKGVRKSSAPIYYLGGLRLAALIFLILGLARPQKGLRSEEMTTKATDIMLVLDASRSMTSIDFQPKNRFDVAKEVMSEFVKGREHDRMGLVLFAEHAITQCPLTTDKGALLNLLDAAEIGSIPPDQTAIGVGIATAVNRIKNSKAKSKVIILVTDGANNAGTIDPLTAAKTAASHSTRIYTIGAGSPEGGMVPIDDPMLGRRLVQIPDELDETLLRKLADETNGKYFRARTSGGLKTIFTEIDGLEKTEISVKEYIDYEELYLWFLLAALGLIMLEIASSKTFLRTLP